MWFFLHYVDEMHWPPDAHLVANGAVLTPEDITYIHPGTTIVYPAAGLIVLGLDPGQATRTVMALFVALGIAGISTVVFLLKPESVWWLAASLLLAGDIRLIHATPPSALAALLSVFIIFLCIYWRTKGSRSVSYIFAFGILFGVLLATRIDVGLFMLGTAFILFFLTDRRMIFMLPVTAVTFFISDPHLWYAPIHHLQSMAMQVSANTALYDGLWFPEIISSFPFAFIAVGMSLVLFFRKQDLGIPHDVYLWLMGATAILTFMLSLSAYHPPRYFLPVYLIWDILFLRWLLMYVGVAARALNGRWLTERNVVWALVVALALKAPVIILATLNIKGGS